MIIVECNKHNPAALLATRSSGKYCHVNASSCWHESHFTGQTLATLCVDGASEACDPEYTDKNTDRTLCLPKN